jgi:predicted dehydrogenase
MEKIRWGILGTGKIARAFCQGLKFVPDAELVAVGSRSESSAKKFAEEFDVPHLHAAYSLLAQDPDVDIIYVATPHAVHAENMRLCLEAGKAVLCEKPFTINASQAKSVIDLARKKNIFLMEAMWTRYIPLIVKLRELVSEGIIGDLKFLEVGMGFIAPRNDPSKYFFDPNMGGGILLDGGSYAVSLASMIFQSRPSRISSMAFLGDAGVDEQSAIIFGYEGDPLAVLYLSFSTRIPPAFRIMGSKGRITVHPPLFNPTKMTITDANQVDELMEIPFIGNGYNYEIEEAMRCLRESKMESDIMPLAESLDVMSTMDEIRSQWNLKYPME